MSFKYASEQFAFSYYSWKNSQSFQLCLGKWGTAVTVTQVIEAYWWLRHFWKWSFFWNDVPKAFHCSGKRYAILSPSTLPLKAEKVHWCKVLTEDPGEVETAASVHHRGHLVLPKNRCVQPFPILPTAMSGSYEVSWAELSCLYRHQPWPSSCWEPWLPQRCLQQESARAAWAQSLLTRALVWVLPHR